MEQPDEVALATRCLIVNLGIAVFGDALAYAPLGLVPWGALAWLPLELVLRGGFIALISHGVAWARKLLLLVIACRAAFAIWQLLWAVAGNHIFRAMALHATLSGAALLIDFYVAYLLLQPESAEWFRR
jgi:hypothetical protein